MPDIILPIRRLMFSHRDRDAFSAQLTEDNRAKRILQVEDCRSIFLDPECRLGGKYALTTVGASQYFGALAQGIYPTVRSLVNEEHPDVRTSATSSLVAQIVNRVAQHRAPALLGSRAICCDERRQLDGFVSSKYVMVSNEEVFGLFTDACDLMRGPMRMFLGAIAGREMTALVMSKAPLNASVPGKLFLGALCQNGETVGRAIRMTVVVVDSISQSWSASPFGRDARIPHVRSRRLRERMMELGDLLGSKQRDVEKRAPSYAAAYRRVVSPTGWNDRTILRLRSQLVAKGHDLYVNTTHVDAALDCLPSNDGESPTQLQLYHACLAAADRLAVSKSLPLRQLAFRLVFGD